MDNSILIHKNTTIVVTDDAVARLSPAQTRFMATLENWHIRIIEFHRSDFWTFRTLKERGFFEENPMQHVLPCKRGIGFALTSKGFDVARALGQNSLGFFLDLIKSSDVTPHTLSGWVLSCLYFEGEFNKNRSLNDTQLDILKDDLLRFMLSVRLVNRLDVPTITLSARGIEFCEQLKEQGQ